MKDGGPAFPCTEEVMGPVDYIKVDRSGISTRDYFAAKALQGLIADGGQVAECSITRCAEWCYEIADAMLAERSK